MGFFIENYFIIFRLNYIITIQRDSNKKNNIRERIIRTKKISLLLLLFLRIFPFSTLSSFSFDFSLTNSFSLRNQYSFFSLNISSFYLITIDCGSAYFCSIYSRPRFYIKFILYFFCTICLTFF